MWYSENANISLSPEIMYDFTVISVGTHRQGDISCDILLQPFRVIILMLINIVMVAPSLDIPSSLSLMVLGSYLSPVSYTMISLKLRRQRFHVVNIWINKIFFVSVNWSANHIARIHGFRIQLVTIMCWRWRTCSVSAIIVKNGIRNDRSNEWSTTVWFFTFSRSIRSASGQLQHPHHHINPQVTRD